MTDEKSYILGQRALAMRLLSQLLPYLPEPAAKNAQAQLILAESLLVLSGVFDKLGIAEEFDPELHLADLIRRLEKALPDRGDE